MTEEEKKAIKSMKRFVECRQDMTAVTASELKTVLNLLEKKDIDIIETKEANRQLSVELQKKDKILDLMIKVMIDSSICDYFIKQNCKHYAGENKKLCDVCIKEYFERKVENETSI